MPASAEAWPEFEENPPPVSQAMMREWDGL
jgi:hypothetical protein